MAYLAFHAFDHYQVLGPYLFSSGGLAVHSLTQSVLNLPQLRLSAVIASFFQISISLGLRRPLCLLLQL